MPSSSRKSKENLDNTGLDQPAANASFFEFTELTLQLTRNKLGNKWIESLRFEGRIDNQNAYKLNRKVHNIIETFKGDMIVDLNSLIYINSIGIAILFSIFHRQKENKKKVIIGGMHPSLKEVFQLVFLPPQVDILNNMEEAKKALA